MPDDRKRVLRRIFDQVVEIDVADRSGFIRRECGDDQTLRAEIESLLAHETAVPSDFLVGSDGTDVAILQPGDVLDRYTIEQLVGEGAFGVVYSAHQSEPVHRRVAIKVLKPGMDTPQIVQRFEAEREALALMDHPCVATVHDAGTTTTGYPYFVMEHVSGVPITEHCDRQRLGVDERLRLFMQVCDAVQHAHQKGIIHRDIKPSNILVTLASGAAVPKVIDFGVAKALHRKLTTETLFTEQGQIIGTPEYMSPEQAEMTAQDIDTRSDVYSLGVLLYELLTGERPFSSATLRRAGVAEIQRIIREVDPPKPSTRLSDAGGQSAAHAAQRSADPKTLARALRGDLDWIVMKALEKNRARRYETASAFANDIQRHLEHEPVRAGPPSAGYRLHKFVRRHRVGVVATTFVGAALVVGIAGLTWGLVEATQAREEAIDEAEKFEEIALFIDEMLAGVRPEIAGTLDKTLVRMILDEAARRVDRELSDRPVIEAAIRGTIGRTYSAVGEYPDAVRHLERALLLRTQELGADDRDTIQTMIDLAHVNALEGDFTTANQLAMRTHETARTSFGAVDETTLAVAVHLATLYRMSGNYVEAESILLETIAVCREQLGSTQDETLDATYELANLYVQQERNDEAVDLHREVLAARERDLSEVHPLTIGSMDGLAMALMRVHEFAEAEALSRRVLDLRKDVFGPEHPETLKAMHNLTVVLQDAGRLSEAEQGYLELREIRDRVSGPTHPDTLKLVFNLARVYAMQGRDDEALALHILAYETRVEALGARHPHTLDSQRSLVDAYHQVGRNDEALPLCEDLLEFRRAEPQPDDERILGAMNLLAIVCTGLAKYDRAQQLNLEVLEARRRLLGEQHIDTLCSMMNVAWLYTEQGRYEEAAPYQADAVRGARGIAAAHSWYLGAFLGDYAETLVHLGRYDECEPVLREAYEVLEETLGPSHGRALAAIQGLVWLYERKGDSERAAEWKARLPVTSDAGN